MKKNITLMAVLFCLIFTMALPVGAASQVVCETTTVTTVYGDIEVEETLVIYTNLRSNTKSVDKTSTYRQGGSVIAEVTLNATFGYDGKTYGVWSYNNERITKSGGTARLSAALNAPLSQGVSVNISLTCSPSGSIS